MSTIIQICVWLVLIYFIALHALYFLLIAIGALQTRRYRKEITFAEFERIAASELSMPVSVIIPVFNEEGIAVETVKNALSLHYPKHEVLVVDDGSTDSTMSRLIEEFRLFQVEKQGAKHIPTREVLGIFESAEHPNLVVLTKENGRRGDAINAAVAVSRYPLLCVIDADCVLESDGLLHMARPFLRDSNLAAAAGVVRPSNGLRMRGGRIVEHGLPKSLLGLNQEIEYARSFQWARIGLCRLQSMLCISGALLLIKKSVFEAVGGSWPNAITDDIEFTIRLNKHIHDRQQDRTQHLAFAPDAVCYTEVPEKFRQYGSQRNRWQRGTLQALFRNWKMILNPRYGLSGLFGMPFFMIFEAFSAVVELLAYMLIPLTLLMGVAGAGEILVMLYAAYITGVFLALSAILLSETGRLRAASWRDFWKMIAAVFLDNLGIHQWHLLNRVLGTFQYLVLRRRDLGMNMDRLSPHTTTP